MTTDTENLIAKGRHLARVRVSPEAVQFGITGEGANAKEQVVVLFDLIDQNDADYGRSISAFLFFTDKTVDRSLESLRHCGWKGDEIAEVGDMAARGELANDVELVVEHEFYQPDNGEGKWQAKVRWINTPGGGAVKLKKPLEGRDLASFSARMKGRARMVGGGAPNGGGSRPSTSSQSSQHPNAPGNDDLPF